MFCDISVNSYIKLKDEITTKIKKPETSHIGGPGYIVEIDETSVYNGMIIKQRTSTADEIPEIQ